MCRSSSSRLLQTFWNSLYRLSSCLTHFRNERVIDWIFLCEFRPQWWKILGKIVLQTLNLYCTNLKFDQKGAKSLFQSNHRWKPERYTIEGSLPLALENSLCSFNIKEQVWTGYKIKSWSNHKKQICLKPDVMYYKNEIYDNK